MSSVKNQQVSNLLSQIEEELDWGASQDWAGADFESLSDLIFERTQKRLSVTTLKRTWGRTSQSVNQSNTTLDILSQYAGSSSWREFLKACPVDIIPNNSKGDVENKKYNLIHFGGGLILGSIILFIVLGTVSSNQKERVKPQIDDVKLDIQKVTNGIPNTVVFRYDVGSILADTLELQQSWDERKRILLDPMDSLITTTYFSPGYFNAKLVADGEIITNENLYLSSDGLQTFVFLEDEKNPRLLSKDHWNISSDGFQLGSTYDQSFTGKEKNLLLIVNLMDEPQINADSFEFSTAFKLLPNEEGDPCNSISIIVTGSDDVYMFDLGNPGCAGQFSSYLGGDYSSGKNNDFSAMGFLEDEWVDIRVKKTGSNVVFSTNDKDIMLSDSAMSIGLIGGVRMYSSQKIALRTLDLRDANQAFDLLEKSNGDLSKKAL